MSVAGSVHLKLRVARDNGRIAEIIVDRPDKLNVVNSALLAELGRHLETLATTEGLRLLVLRGAGERAFIGGADITEMVDLDPDGAADFIGRLHRVCSALRCLPVPVVAQISGFCLGAGVEVAISCDLRVASEDATFGMPEVRVGIPSVIEAALLPRLVGSGRARELVLTGRSLGAREALEWGLVERVVPAAELATVVEEWSDDILSAGPAAIRLQKALCREWEELPLTAAVEEGIRVFAESYRGDEPRRLMTRFLDRRRGASS